MIAVDTNIVVRLLTQDDELQYQKSLEIFHNHQIFISDTVILETEWVLRFAYKFKPEEICGALRKLFGLANVHLSNARLVTQVLHWHEAGLYFADAFHLAHCQNYTHLYTFDQRFVKRATGLTTCEVTTP
jgi:predicted nucleic-acid-binding protein